MSLNKVIRFWQEFWGIVLFLTRPFSECLISYIYRIFMGKTKQLPPITNKILLMPAVELAEKIRKKQLKCEDVVQAYIDRDREVQPYINAITDARYDEALEEARLIDRFLERDEKTPEEIEKETPLLGVPFTCKEAIGVKGLSQTAGIYSAKGHVADKDSDAAALYRAAGAIPLTVTNVPELCMWWDSTNYIFGVTKNPYDNARTCGGSTGGEGALLGAAGAVIGIGNDVGGSIRIPCSFCGIYGHKTSTGIRNSQTAMSIVRNSSVVSNAGEFPHNEVESKKLNDFLSTGPMCRYAKDLPLLMKILSANDERLALDKEINFKNVKIYYMEGFPGKYEGSVPDVKKAIQKAAKYFEEKYGVKAIPLKIDELRNAIYIWECKVLETNVGSFKSALADESGKINLWLEMVKKMFRLSKHTLPCIFFGMIDRRKKDQFYYDRLKDYARIESKFLEIFEDDAIVLIPTHPEPPPFYHLTIPKYKNVGYTAIFNILGFPSTNVPAGLSNGVPFGIQVISGHFSDRLTIAAAVELDNLFGGWKSPSPIAVE